MEAIIAGGLSVLSLQIAGVSIKEIVPSALGFSWKLYLTYKKSTLMTKLTKMIITYTEGKYPHKEVLKVMKNKIKELFKRFNKAEIVETIKYYKELKDLFYAVNFNCSYWEKHKDTLLVNPEKLRDYMVKKIYIERIKDIIVVKLYNNILSKEDLQDLQNELMEEYMNDRVSIDLLDKIVVNIEKFMREQYKSQKERYDKDFKEEKDFLSQILLRAGEGDYTTRTDKRVSKLLMRTTIDIIGELQNEQEEGADNVPSKFVMNTRSLSQENIEEINEEDQTVSMLNN